MRRLKVLPVSVLATLAPSTKRDSVSVGSASVSDSADLTVSTNGSAPIAWTARATASWARLSTTSGTGSSRLRWTRDPGGLRVGVYVDTIKVSVTGIAAPVRLLDSLQVAVVPPMARAAATYLLGTSSLSDDQRAFLDGQGNRNGVYDLATSCPHPHRAASPVWRTRHALPGRAIE